MKSKHFKWLGIGILSLCCFGLLATGASLALGRSIIHKSPAAIHQKIRQIQQQQQHSPQQSDKNLLSTGPITIFAMGDSLTRGYGDSTGFGYVGNLQHDLEAAGRHVTVDNIAVNGYISSQLLSQIKDTGIQKRIANSNVVLLSIGGNDLVHSVENFISPTVAQSKSSEQSYLQNLKTIIQTVRANNKNAPILMVGLYNPFLQLQGGAAGTAIVEEWNSQTSTLLRSFPNTFLVPTLDLFTANGDKLLYTDHFHPNSSGYKAIAARMVQDLDVGQ